MLAMLVVVSSAAADISGSEQRLKTELECHLPGTVEVCFEVINASTDGEAINYFELNYPRQWEILSFTCDGVDDLGSEVFLSSGENSECSLENGASSFICDQ